MPRSATKVTLSHDVKVRQLYEKAEDLERQLDAATRQQRGSSGGGGDDKNRLRLPLCETMADLILRDPAFSAEKDIAGRLWRSCFYTRIGPWRAHLLKDKRRGADTTRLEESLGLFLSEGVTLYQYLINRLQTKLAKNAGMPVGDDSTASFSQASASVAPPEQEITDGIVSLLATCHLSLGDLFRYSNNLDQAEKAYQMAATLAPGFGHAFNQLAVICQLKEQQGSPLSAVAFYWYTRALLVSTDPFTIAKSNLTRLLASNHEWVKQQAVSSDRSKSAQTRRFLGMFVDLQYRFFQGIDESFMKDLMEQIKTVTDGFRELLEISAFGDALLCRLVVIHAFSECFLDRPNGNPSRTTMVLARVATYQFGSCLTDRVMVGLSKVAEGKLPSSVRLLLPILLLAEYTASVSMPETDNSQVKVELAKATQTFWQGMINIWNKLSQMVPADMLPATQNDELKAFLDLRGFGPFGFLPPCAGGHLSNEEALHELLHASSKKEKPNDAASTGTSAVSGAATDQGRLKLARILRLADQLMDDTSGTIGKYIKKDGEGNFVWFDGDYAEAQKQELSQPMEVEPAAEEDMLVYKEVDGGPALLVPGMLLQQDTSGEAVAKMTPRKTSMSPDNQDQSVASERLPVFDATPVNLQHTDTPLAIPHPTEASLATPTGAPAFGPPAGIRLPPGLDPGMGMMPPPPPGFAAAPPPVPPPTQQPETIGEALRLYGEQLQTANPFADAPPGLSNAFSFSAQPATNGATFLGASSDDPMSVEGTSLLDSGLLNSLWMDDPKSKTKNPFAT